MIITIENSKYLDITVKDFLNEAKKYLGKPYVYGGDGTPKACLSSSCGYHTKGKKYTGYDCSGYVYSLLSKWNYNKFGRSTSQMQSSSGYGKWIYNKSDLLPGDLIFFKGHVGIVSSNKNGNVLMYHASKCGTNICEADSKYRKDFTKGLRILKPNIKNLKNEGSGYMNLLLIDSGHAKNTPGKNNAKENFYEWQFNNSMQYKLKKRAEDHNIHVFLSNPNPEKVSDIDLTKRANLMNNYWKSKGNPKALMISVHANAYSDPSARGTETYTAGNASSASKSFARDVNNEIVKVMKSIDSNAKDRGIKTENFTVIYKTHTPCALIEYGFYSNPGDLKILKNNENELVEATIKAICRYFGVTYKPVSNSTVSNEKKNYTNCVLYGNDVDKVAAEIIGWAKPDCIVKHIDNHVKWEGSNLFIVGGSAETKMKQLNNGENYSVIKGNDRYDTVRKCLAFVGK